MKMNEAELAALLKQNPCLRVSESASLSLNNENQKIAEPAKIKQRAEIEKIQITLPYPPTVNNLYSSYLNRRILSKGGRDYKAAVIAICVAENILPIYGNVRVIYKVYRRRKIGDLDNYKILFDSIKGFAYEDDKQITEIHAYRYDDKHKPRVELTIEKII